MQSCPHFDVVHISHLQHGLSGGQPQLHLPGQRAEVLTAPHTAPLLRGQSVGSVNM